MDNKPLNTTYSDLLITATWVLRARIRDVVFSAYNDTFSPSLFEANDLVGRNDNKTLNTTQSDMLIISFEPASAMSSSPHTTTLPALLSLRQPTSCDEYYVSVVLLVSNRPARVVQEIRP
jgi:hypothetical protein